MDEGDHRHLDRDRSREETREQSGGDRDSAEELDEDEQIDESDGVLVSQLRERRRHRLRAAGDLAPAVHGWGKSTRGAQTMAPTFAKLGYEHPVALVYLLIFVEFFGGIAIAAGLFTRFFAAA